MPFMTSSRVVSACLALVAGFLMGSCSAAPRATPVVGAREWLAMTVPGEDPNAAGGLAFTALAPTPGSGRAGAPVTDAVAPMPAPAAAHEADGDHVLHAVLLYIPDRIFDLLDIVRLRLRLGLGFAADIRATEAADAYVGFYSSLFVGIPGPRRAPFANWPIGFENRSGAELSVVDVASDGRDGPHYGQFEFGLGAHLGLIGLDLGIDPWEAVDFVTGIIGIDPVGDDL